MHPADNSRQTHGGIGGTNLAAKLKSLTHPEKIDPAACTRIASITLLAPRLPCSEPGARMPIPARAAAMRLIALLVGLLTCQATRTPSTLNAPTHYTRSRPFVLETPQYDICHGSNRVHAR